MSNRISNNRKKSSVKLGGMDQQPSGRKGEQDNSDIDAVFRGVRQTRGMVRRGLSGEILNPDGTDPGNSFDRFMRQNPHLGGAAQRQAQYDQQARGNMASAVAERRALQEIQANTPNPNLVIDANGYRTIFDNKGGVIGTTAPVKNSFRGYQGEDAATAQAAFNRGEGTNAERDVFRRNLQQAGLDSAAGKLKKPSKSSGIDQIFGGGTKQPSPSGVARGGLVEPTQPKGAPGGELFGPPNPYAMGPNAGPQRINTRMGPNEGPQYDYTMPPNAGPQYTPMMPNEGPQNPSDFGPQLPYSGGEQLMALKRLYGFGGDTNPTLTTLEGTWNNIFPGVNDYEYLRQLFPGLVHPQAGSGQLMSLLAQMYQNPAYQALFPQVNQSEFYK